jgi:hypothetical protein
MLKIKLKLGEILQLESEINGLVNQESGKIIYEGFLKQNLSIILKYGLNELSELLKTERKKVEVLRDELIKKYGEENNEGSIFVKMYDEIEDEEGNVIGKKFNEKYLKFEEEYSVFLNVEKEIEYPEITKEDLKDSGKSNDDYRILFKLIRKD